MCARCVPSVPGVGVLLAVLHDDLVHDADRVVRLSVALHQDHLLLEAIRGNRRRRERWLVLMELLVRVVVRMAGMAGVEGRGVGQRLEVALLRLPYLHLRLHLLFNQLLKMCLLLAGPVSETIVIRLGRGPQ